jgi:hypothetical protein
MALELQSPTSMKTDITSSILVALEPGGIIILEICVKELSASVTLRLARQADLQFSPIIKLVTRLMSIF